MRDPALLHTVAEWITGSGLRCERFADVASLVRALHHRGGIDLALIDMGHAPEHEASVLGWLACRSTNAVPVILVASHWSGQQVARALEAGADDCIGKPPNPVESMARIRAVLRRRSEAAQARTRIDLAGFTLDRGRGTLQNGATAVRLTPREFALAWLFFSSPGERMGRDAIGFAIWGAGKDIANRTIEQHVYKLRRKLPLNDERGVVIRTTYGCGYRLEVCERTACEAAPQVPWLGWGVSMALRPFAPSSFGDMTP